MRRRCYTVNNRREEQTARDWSPGGRRLLQVPAETGSLQTKVGKDVDCSAETLHHSFAYLCDVDVSVKKQMPCRHCKASDDGSGLPPDVLEAIWQSEGKAHHAQRNEECTSRVPIYRFAKHAHASASLERCWGRQENNEVSDYMLVTT